MHARINMLIGDPARIEDVIRYLEGTVRPHVESQPGCRGLAVLVDAELGLTMAYSYWETAETMAASEHAVQTARKEARELAQGSMTVERHEVPIFLRHARPPRGAGVRITTIETDPADVDATIEAFRDRALPTLSKMPGLCSAQFMADRHTGRCQAIVAFESARELAASRTGVARLRADSVARTHATVRSVQELTLVSTTVREGGTNTLTEREAELWNIHDRAGWAGLLDQQAFELRAPGGIRLAGREAVDAMWRTFHGAFPDNHVETVAVYGDEHGGVLEARFTGTHTGALRAAGGDIPATGKRVDLRFCQVHRVQEGKIIDSHLYFDRLELLEQLGRTSG